MNLPTGAPNTNREQWLSTLSIVVGVLVGLTVGPCLFFFLYIFAIPIGLLVGGFVGSLWGRRNPITVTGFGSLGVVLAEAVFIWGERSLPLPTRAITWFVAPAVGGLGIWLLPYLARIIWPEQRTRENAAMAAVVAFLLVPLSLLQLMPKDPIQSGIDSANVQSSFFLSCDALAEAEGHHATRNHPPKPAPHLLLLRSFPELCCPGIPASLRNQEVGIGDWHIVMHFITNAHFAETVAYYQNLLPGSDIRQKPVDVPFPCTRISGFVRGEPVSVIVADVPERGVGVAIF